MSRRFNPDRDVAEWSGRYSPYDIVKEGTIALVVVLLATFALAIVFGSPDDHPVTLRQWAQHSPLDFATTALSEMNGTSTSASYGAPYDTQYANNQTLGPLKLAQWAGVRVPVDSERDFVLLPLTTVRDNATLSTDLATWDSASTAQRTAWITNYTASAGSMAYVNGHLQSGARDAGPVPLFLDSLTTMARSGALDQALETGKSFYTMDYTKPLLFLSDGNYFANLGEARHLGGDQWGMMNETGNYPGQAWLWLYTFWYQVPPWSTSGNGDALVWGTMMLLTLGLLLVPFLPVVRSIPRWSRLYRVIWREHYRTP
jgi:hypothetical protein